MGFLFKSPHFVKMHFNEIHVGLRVKSNAIALRAPFGLLLENEALSNRKRTSNDFHSVFLLKIVIGNGF